MASAESIDFPITARDLATETFKKVTGGLNTMGESFEKLQKLMYGGLAFEFFKQIAEAADEAEKAEARLGITIRAVGAAAGFSKQELEAYADARAAVTQFDDESYKNAAATLLKFGNVQHDVFLEALNLAGDWAAFTGGDLQSGAQAIGRALQSPSEGLRNLEREFGKIDPLQKQSIENFLAQNKLMEAQAVVLDVVRGKIGGAAEEMNDSWLKSINDVKKAWNEMMESIGKSWIGSGAKATLDAFAQAMESIKALFNPETWSARPYGTPAPSAMDSLFAGAAGSTAGPAPGPTKEYLEAQKKAADEARKNSLERQKLIDDENKKFEESQRLWAEDRRADAEALFTGALKQTNQALKDQNDLEFATAMKIAQRDEELQRAADAEGERQEAQKVAMQERFLAEQAKLADQTKANANFARELGLTFSSAFESAVVHGKSLRQVLQGIGQDILQMMVRMTITQPLANSIGGLFNGGGGLGGLIGSLFPGSGLDNAITNARFGGGDWANVISAQNSYMGFATGGSFTVGGRGGTDSQMVSFRATPGEKVSVQTPGQQDGGGDTYVIDARGADAAGMAQLRALIVQLNGSIEQRALNVVKDQQRRGN